MNCHYMQIKIVAEGLICCSGISIFYNSPLKRGDFVVSAQSNDKGVCKFAATHPQPLFLEGSLKVAAAGSLIYLVSCFLAERIFTFRCSRIKGNEEFRFIPPLKD